MYFYLMSNKDIYYYYYAQDAQEQAPTQVPNYDKFVNVQTTLALFDNAANQRAPGDLQLEDWTRPSPWGLLHIVFSL